MAAVALGFAGKAIGGAIGGSFLGIGAGTWGGAIGSLIGGLIDNKLFPMRTEGPRLSDLTVQSSAYGQAIPRIYGEDNRIAGNIIWSSGLIETKKKVKQGGKGGPSVTSTEYSYRTNIAVALSEGIASRVKKIWANNKLIYDIDGTTEWGLFSAVRFYPGSFTQDPDPTMESFLGMGNVPAYRGTCYVVIADFQLADFGNRIPNLEFLLEKRTGESAATVALDIVRAAGMDTNQVSTSSLWSFPVRGLVIGTRTSADAAIQPLALAFNFDLADQGGSLRFYLRESGPKGVIETSELGGRDPDQENSDPIRWSLAPETTLPRQATVTFSDPERDFQPNTQADMRSEGTADNNLETQIAMVLTADEGRAIASRLLWEAWNSRHTATGAVTDRYRHVQPGELYLFSTPAGLEPLRILRNSRGVNGVIEMELIRDNVAVYSSSTSGASADVPPNIIRAPGPSVPILLDLPLLVDQDDAEASGFYWGVQGSGFFRGADLMRSVDPLSPYVEVGAQGLELTTGEAPSALPPPLNPFFDSTTDFDDDNVLVVELSRPGDALESVDDASLVAGANAVYLGPPDGHGGEIIQFGTATEIAPGEYELSHLRRGQRGTEFSWGGHGDEELFVLLQAGALQRSDFSLSDIGLSRSYKAVSLLTSEDEADPVDWTNTGAGLRPYSPVNLAAGAPDPDITLSWDRRSRIGWPAVVPPPLAEDSEAYIVRIMSPDGSSLIREEEVESPSFVYTEAMQIADFGAALPFAPRWRVAQVSAAYGPGVFADSVLALGAAIIEAFATPPSDAVARAIYDLVNSLVVAGVWRKLSALYVLAAEDEQAARINWISPGEHTLTAHGSPDFAALEGFTGDGSSTYLDWGVEPGDLPNFGLSDATLFVWSNTNLNQNGRPDLGTTGGNTTSIFSRSGAGNLGCAVNGSNINYSVPDSLGLGAASRSGSTVTIYKNGALGSTTNQTVGAMGAGTMCFLRANTQYTTRQIAAGGAGAYLSAGEHEALYDALGAYMAAVGL